MLMPQLEQNFMLYIYMRFCQYLFEDQLIGSGAAIFTKCSLPSSLSDNFRSLTPTSDLATTMRNCLNMIQEVMSVPLLS